MRQAAFHVRDARQENRFTLGMMEALKYKFVPMMRPRPILQQVMQPRDSSRTPMSSMARLR